MSGQGPRTEPWGTPCRTMEWFTVSKAVLRLRRRRMVRVPESEESRSFVTLRNCFAVMVGSEAGLECFVGCW